MKRNKIDVSTLTFKPFKPIWNKLKWQMEDKHFEFFYDVIDIDGTCGRRVYYPGIGREYNPRFYSHWFAQGRCHWNVALPCFILNNDSLVGDYKIITTERHSAILDSKRNIFYCPTLNDEKCAREMLEKDCVQIELIELLPYLSGDIEKFKKFVEEHFSNEEMQKWPTSA